MTVAAQLFAGVGVGQQLAPPALPPLPRTVNYWDDFHERNRNVGELESIRRIVIHDDGEAAGLDLDHFSPFQRAAVLHVVAYLLERNDVSTATEWLQQFGTISRKCPAQLLDRLAGLPPFEVGQFWDAHIYPDLAHPRAAACLRKILHVFCDLGVGAWAPEYHSIVSRLPSPHIDPFAVVKSGECFIPIQHQQIVYDFLDELAVRAHSNENLGLDILCEATAILLVDQHALRPGSLARIKTVDVRIHDTGAVHVSVLVTKKQNGSQRVLVTRRIKRDWCPIVRALVELRVSDTSTDLTEQRLFGLTPGQLSKIIGDRMEVLTGERWTATDLRHTSAQRLADAGASADQLAEFMLHNNTLVGNVYFEQSPSQAARVNQALAISPIYSSIPEIHRTRTIDKATLLGLSEDHQIGGVPHGIPIAGIGACQLGQCACQKNPVLSCYGCRQFLAVSDAQVHETVVESLRPVVREFYEAGRGEDRSPAYAQLQRTLTVANAIAQNIKAA